jgi:hypothetical protein
MSVVVSCSPPLVLDIARQTVAVAQPGLLVGVSSPPSIPRCGHNGSLLCGGSGSSDFTVTVTEGFPSAFKPRNIGPAQNVPGGPYHTESGFYDHQRCSFQLVFRTVADVVGLETPGNLELVEVGCVDLIHRAITGAGQIRVVGGPLNCLCSGTGPRRLWRSARVRRPRPQPLPTDRLVDHFLLEHRVIFLLIIITPSTLSLATPKKARSTTI